jgi:hypothetical protein
MARRFIQIILVISVLCSAAAQTLACIPMMQYGDHSCCRSVSAKKISQKMRAASSPHKQPVESSQCCKGAASKSQQPPVENRNSRQDGPAIFADATDLLVTPLKRSEAVHSLRSHAPPDYSPPHFILYHALLI